MTGRAVAVIGGGIGGLTAALAFAQRGASVIIFEQAAALTEVGAGLQITPNGARVLYALGLGEAFEKIGVAAQAVVPTDGLTGKAVTRFDLSAQRPRYRFVHRADLIDLLANACADAGVTVALGQSIDAPPTGFELTIGAEGLHSPSRHRLNAPRDPFFTHQVAWRAVIKFDAAPEARIWMLPGAHVVTYPLTHGRLNIVAVQEREDWAADGWSHQDNPDKMRAAFPHGCNELRGILDAVDEVGLWGLFRYEVAENWVSDDTAILGDAAHPTLPFLAQGANLAIEDGYVLARCCAETADQTAALRRYEVLRKQRVTRAIATANANAMNYHLRGPRRAVSHLALKGIGKVAPRAFLDRLSWLYDHDVTAS